MTEFPKKEIIDDGENGTIEDVMVSRVGEYTGSTVDGKPVEQVIDAESLQKLADRLNEQGTEVLADVDHAAARPGLDRDTSAAGWFHRFVVDPLKGLFARLRLTKRGRELVENREYRFLSPSFLMGEDGRPVDLASVSLTNTPAMYDIQPILNSKPEDKITMEITKEELVELIKSTVTALNAKPAEEPKEEVVENACSEEKKEETVENACSEEKPVENACSEEKKEETVNETPEEKTEEKEEPEKTETPAEEEKPEDGELIEEEKEEVIKIEALNHKPVAVNLAPAWQDLHGQAFWDYLSKHPDVK